MMSIPKKSFIVDPDYELTEVAREHIRLKEDRENREKAEKIKDIINREFKTELDHRQSQLELIQQRLNQAQKTLHLLRYVLITSYYSDKDVTVNQLAEQPNTTDGTSVFSNNRIHPAIKKLLGNNPSDYKLNFATSPRKKMRYSEEHREATAKPEKSCAAQVTELNSTCIETNKINNQHVATLNDIKHLNSGKAEYDTVRNRKKYKYRVVVGNISKWMPSDSEEDKSTHKWMVYVRGSKESPDISHFVQKVVFYLHPSYQPNDVVELREGPFHLARRGWGEFPLRVKIFFQCSLNKPVDIIHNLKLDRTFTGRQTLGNETIVNLFLYNDEDKLDRKSKNCVSPFQSAPHTSIKEEPDVLNDISDFHINERDLKLDIEVHDIKQERTVPHTEHDYCFLGFKQQTVKEELDPQPSAIVPSGLTQDHYSYNCLMEHSYFINSTFTHTNGNIDFGNPVEQQQTDLIYGIDFESSRNEVIEEAVLDDVKIPTRKTVPGSLQRLVISNNTVVAIKKRRKPQQSLLKKMFCKKFEKKSSFLSNTGAVSVLKKTCSKNESNKRLKPEVAEKCVEINYEKYKVDFPSHRFKSVREALPYLFKRLPILTELVSDLDYKCTYPYAAKSLEEYSSWSIGKRLSSEWFQAKTILKIIVAAQLSDFKNWTVKSLIKYARSHGYTPLPDYKIFKNKTYETEEVLNGVTHSDSVKAYSTTKITPVHIIEPDIMVDVINCTPDPEPSNISVNKEKLVDYKLDLVCSYVKQAVLDIGIILKPEEIIPGVIFNAAERLLLQAALCLAEDLLRQARANLVLQGNFRDDYSTIGIEEIQKVLRERPQFNVLLKSSIRDQ